MSSAQTVLKNILLKQDQKMACVFDLDSTLFNVSPRTQKILQDYGHSSLGHPHFSSQKEILKKIQILPTDWGIREALIRENVSAPLTFFEDVRRFWRQHFFSNEYLQFDRPYPGAVEFVDQISKAGIPIYYLTGRDRPDMHTGTVETLQKWGFPTEQIEGRLFMKPSKNYSEDEDYKVQILTQFSTRYKTLYFFENEPVIINQVQKVLPDVNIIFMDTVHSRRENPPNDIVHLTGDFTT